jgi:hypothetical protein
MCFRCFVFFRFQFCGDFLRVAPRIPAVFHLMNEGRTVFAQLLDHLPKYEFDKCVARYHGNFRVRKLPAYEQFLVAAFAQLTWRESLRDIETCLASFGPKLYHAGIRQPASSSGRRQALRAAVRTDGGKARQVRQKPLAVEDFIKRFYASGSNVGLGFFPNCIQLAGGKIGVNLLVPFGVEIFLKPAGHLLRVMHGKFLQGIFNFGNRAHGGNLIRQGAFAAGKSSPGAAVSFIFPRNRCRPPLTPPLSSRGIFSKNSPCCAAPRASCGLFWRLTSWRTSPTS